MPKKSLKDILGDADQFGLLDVKPVARATSSDEQRIRDQFEKINKFIDKKGREPGTRTDGPTSITESQLQISLAHLRSDPASRVIIAHLDRHGLLRAVPSKVATSAPGTLDEILSLDNRLLSTPADHIFALTHAPRPDVQDTRAVAAEPDRVSERKACADFASYKPLFEAAAADLEAGRRKAIKFSHEQTIKAGQFFILNGVTAFVAEVGERQIRNGKPDARLRVIFENGTEGDNLLRSLASKLYSDPNGRRLTDPGDVGPLFAGQLEESKDGVPVNAKPDTPMQGCIYVVRSLSKNPSIKAMGKDFFKIGFTQGSAEDRIRNAKDDPTFLLAPAHLLRTYTVNVSPNRLENLMHRFFGKARLDIEIVDRFGKPRQVREWFNVPLETIERAVALMIDGTIVDFEYDKISKQIRPINP
jgi:Meiotically up-regulated gene 113